MATRMAAEALQQGLYRSPVRGASFALAAWVLIPAGALGMLLAR